MFRGTDKIDDFNQHTLLIIEGHPQNNPEDIVYNDAVDTTGGSGDDGSGGGSGGTWVTGGGGVTSTSGSSGSGA